VSFIEAASIVAGTASRSNKPPTLSATSKFSLYVFSSPSDVWAFEQDSKGKTERNNKIDLERDTNWRVTMDRSVEKQVCELKVDI
jgi:hypothetical protein